MSTVLCENDTFEGVAVRPSATKGSGVFALRDFRKGETVVVGKREGLVPERTIYSLQLEWCIHVQLDVPARVINHSCSPNTGVRNNQFGGYDFVALEEIRAGEEITFDYETTEYFSIAVSECRCGSPVCRGRTRGFRYLDENVRARYGEFIAGYLKQRYRHMLAIRRDDSATLIAMRPLMKGDIIQELPVERILTEPTYLTVQIGRDAHIDQIGGVAYMNHSCEPNAIVNTTERLVIAARDIQLGEDLTFFYPSTEWEMAQPFECRCGRPSCLGTIRGAKHLPARAVASRFLNRHILEMLAEEQESLIAAARLRGAQRWSRHESLHTPAVVLG